MGRIRNSQQDQDSTAEDSTVEASTRLVPVEQGEVSRDDVLDLGPGNHYVRFPDGVVVTARSEYTVTAVPGDYAVLNTDGEVVKTFTVADTRRTSTDDASLQPDDATPLVDPDES